MPNSINVNSDNKMVISTYHQEVEIRKIENLKQKVEEIYSKAE